MSKRSPGSQQLAALVESIAAQCAPEFSAEQIRFAVLTFARAGVFDVAQPEKVDFSDPVSLPAHRASAEAVLECLAGAARTSVIDRLGRLEERAFKPIVPWEQ
jgi:hypothetical protein